MLRFVSLGCVVMPSMDNKRVAYAYESFLFSFHFVSIECHAHESSYSVQSTYMSKVCWYKVRANVHHESTRAEKERKGAPNGRDLDTMLGERWPMISFKGPFTAFDVTVWVQPVT